MLTSGVTFTPFWCGVGCTLAAELVLLCVAMAWVAWKGKKNPKDAKLV